MKKTLSLIISLIIILPSLLVFSPNTSAKILEECQLKPFATLDSNKTVNDLDFRLAFEKSRTQYHDYVNCVFNKATDAVLKSAGGDIKNLLNPQEACLADKSPQQMKDILADGSPSNLLAPLLKAYQDYIAHLNVLQKAFDEQPNIDQSGVGGFSEFIERRSTFQLLVENEIQNSIIALDSAFIGLKELRSAFVMHLHFQCMLKNLENYRRALENLRSVIEVMPPLFHNASTH